MCLDRFILGSVFYGLQQIFLLYCKMGGPEPPGPSEHVKCFKITYSNWNEQSISLDYFGLEVITKCISPHYAVCLFEKQWRTVAQKNTLYEAFAQTIDLN